MMAPDAESDDGLFNLCIAHQVSRRRVLTLLPHFLRGTQASQKEILTGTASNIEISTTVGALPTQTDGEIISEDGKHLKIELLPLALEVVCGPLESR